MTFPGAYDLILSFILGLGGLFAVIYGAAVAGSEWTWGTLKSTVARGESRGRYMLSSFAGIAVILGLGLLVTFLIGVAVGGARRDDRWDLDRWSVATRRRSGRCRRSSSRGWIVISAEAVASVSRSRRSREASWPASASGSRCTSARRSPRSSCPTSSSTCRSTLATAAVGGGEGFGAPVDPNALSPDLALALLVAWLLGSLVVAAGFTDRAEITG